MATRKDVAKMVGVSTTVVSNVINNRGYVSEKTRKAVTDAIKELGYRPNYIAKSLKTKKSSQLVIIVNEIRNEFFAEIAYAMEEYAYQFGYTTLICNGRDDEEFVRHILDYQANGIFIYSQKMSTRIVNMFAESGVNVIVASNTERKGLDSSITRIQLDSYTGFMTAMTHLVNQGHNRIAYLHGIERTHNPKNDIRIQAYKDALKKYGIAYDSRIVNLNIHSSEVEIAIREMMRQPQPPTAYLCGNDNYAISTVYALIKMGYRVPEDVAVVGNGDIHLSKTTYPSITTIQIPYKDLGVTAAKMLIARINGEKVESIHFSTNFIVRESG